MTIDAEILKNILQIPVKHALFREDGLWYHQLRYFPGALFDKQGLVIIQTEAEFRNTKAFQIGKDLNVVGGIQTLPGYRHFTPIEQQKIKSFQQKREIDEASSWRIFQLRASEYYENHEVILSPSSQKRRYIIDRVRPNIRIKRLDVDVNESSEIIGAQKFKTCIQRINRQIFPIPNGGIYDHRSEEIALVTLLPMLDWSDDGKFIVYNEEEPALEDGQKANPEAPNEDITQRMQAWLKKRRGQKKLRDKLFEVYNGTCAISNCNIQPVLHACHITPFAESGCNISTNAILLRADIHDLFDANLLAIDPGNYTICLHPSIREHYRGLNEKINFRQDGKPLDSLGLRKRWESFQKQLQNNSKP